MRDLSKLIAESFEVWGVPNAHSTARATVAMLVAVGAIPKPVLDAWERDAKIYWLNGKGVSVSAIGRHYGVSRMGVYRALNRTMQRRREGIMQKNSPPEKK
jgi:hypothetical protein